MWSVPEAKARLSEVLRRARAGEPQVIGQQQPCVVISEAEYRLLRPEKHLRQFLASTAPRAGGLKLPPRRSRRGDPFAPRGT